MDPIDGSVEVLNLICATILFIHGVTKDATSPTITTSLSKTNTFLETFSDLCFSDVTGLLRDLRVPQVLLLDTQRSLHALNKALSAHREAWRNIGIAAKLQRQQTVRKRASTIAVDIQGEKKRWRDEMKQRSEIWKERAGPGVHAAFFDIEEMELLVSACGVWTDRLRHTLSAVLLETGERFPHSPTAEQAHHLGLTRMLARQRRLELQASTGYTQLEGRLRKLVSPTQSVDRLMKTIYQHEGEETDVMIEVRPYTDCPAESVRQLTWRLSVSGDEDHAKRSQEGENEMLTLGCMGYIDDSANARSLVIYRSPQSHPWASDPPSLHDLIRKGWSAKLSLDQRFKAARILATTVLDIHTSGSIHGNICSRSVAMLPRQLNDAEPSPFLVGWAVDHTPVRDLHSLEANLYRHGARFGEATEPYLTSHDIYSLGVVLLEIGLWTTMSTTFARVIENALNFSSKDSSAVFRRANKTIVELVSSLELRREMGERYALVVQRCLLWRQDDAAKSLLEFRKNVLDALGAPL